METSIREQLTACLHQVEEAFAELLHRPVQQVLRLQVRNWAKTLGVSLEKMENAEAELDQFVSGPLLEQVPGVDEFDNRMVPFSRACTTRRTLVGLRIALVNRVIEVGANQTVDEFEYYIGRNSYTAIQMLAIANVKPVRATKLAGGITFAPIGNFENPAEYSNRYPNYYDRAHHGLVSADYAPYTIPLAQFAKEYEHPRFFGARQVQERADGRVEGVPDLHDFKALVDACKCLTLIGPSAPVSAGTSIWVSRWAPGVPGPLGQIPTRVDFSPTVNLTDSNLVEYQKIFAAYTGLSQEMRLRVEVPLQRLNLALRRTKKMDSAIDLGIALESLYGEERPFDSSFTFILRLRAARHLSSNRDERVLLAEHIKGLYSLRSKSAHKGQLPKRVKEGNAEDLLKLGGEIVATAIKRFILEGEPNWDDIVYDL